ncbi:MAG TPA: hypothetical protein GX707_10625 [Epulopiscium sp.]|nr:hypothetical protein [Candidatus Epulonipiscium sp.]
MNEWVGSLDGKEKDKAEALLAAIKSGKMILMLGPYVPCFGYLYFRALALQRYFLI